MIEGRPTYLGNFLKGADVGIIDGSLYRFLPAFREEMREMDELFEDEPGYLVGRRAAKWSFIAGHMLPVAAGAYVVAERTGLI